MATRAPSTRGTTMMTAAMMATGDRPTSSLSPFRPCLPEAQETDDPPAPPARRSRRHRTPHRPRRRVAQVAAVVTLGFGPQGRPAAGAQEPRDEPDVDAAVDPVLGRPRGRDVRLTGRW